MNSHRGNIRFHSAHTGLISTERFRTIEEYILHLMHQNDYRLIADMSDNKIVLDLGCNTGYGTRLLAERCKRVVGVDVSLKAIAMAKLRHGSRGIKFLLFDGLRLPFKNGSFDLVASLQVIEHIYDTSAFLAEIKRVLAPGRKAVFTTPNARIRLDPGMPPWNSFHVREYRGEELDQILREFFPKTQVLGLFANEPIYSQEISRSARSREIARRRSPLFFKTRAMLPYWALGIIQSARKLYRTAKKASLPSVPESELRKYSMDDLFYRDRNLDKSINLMAICERER